jgi:methyl-accepting chemotaxis protein
MGQQIVYKDEASAGDRDNAISAKELAATSEEISGMSKDLHHLVAAFKTDD